MAELGLFRWSIYVKEEEYRLVEEEERAEEKEKTAKEACRRKWGHRKKIIYTNPILQLWK